MVTLFTQPFVAYQFLASPQNIPAEAGCSCEKLVEPPATPPAPFDWLRANGLKLVHSTLATCVLLWATTSFADSPYAVTYVYDGDTVKLRNSNSEFKLRLTDIDAPERNQEYGLKARRALIQLCQGNDTLVTAQVTGTDQYHRSLGKLQCNHIDAGTYLAEHGWAWHYEQYSKDINIHNAALQARRQKLGLWASKNPVPPWVWRHNQTH